MMAPFFKFGLFGDNLGLVAAFLIGIGFGFFLERAGFGNARKLAAQFYLTDLRVFKVMFTAIVTAMLGVYYLSVFGFMDLSLVYLTPTFLPSQIAGGLILGAVEVGAGAKRLSLRRKHDGAALRVAVQRVKGVSDLRDQTVIEIVVRRPADFYRCNCAGHAELEFRILSLSSHI